MKETFAFYYDVLMRFHAVSVPFKDIEAFWEYARNRHKTVNGGAFTANWTSQYLYV